MQKSLPIIIIFHFFLILTYSNSLKPSKYKYKSQEFNQYDSKAIGEKLSDGRIAINIKYENNREPIIIGKKGTFYFITDFNDNETNIFDSSDIEEKTSFQTYIKESSYYPYFDSTCRLWKPTHENLRLFCQIYKNLHINRITTISLNNYTFIYGNNIISINFLENWFYVNELELFPFIYSDEQIINIEDEIDYYHLKFNIESYNDSQILYLGGKFLNRKILNNYKVTGKELICEIKKDDLIEILPMNGGNLYLYSFSPENTDYYMQKHINVLNIKVYIKNLKKTDIYVEINKILDKTLQNNNFVSFETNVTNISDLITEEGLCKLNENNYTCYLKKEWDKPLLLLCKGFNEGNYSLNQLINKEITFDNINVKYNFKIQPIISSEEFEISNKCGANIDFIYPTILDFTLKNEYKIYLLFGENNCYEPNTPKLRLAPKFETFHFSHYDSLFSSFNIQSSYFENNLDKYYNLYHLNSLNNYSKYYEVPSFEVIKPNRKNINIRVRGDENKAQIIIGEKGIICFVTNYNDNELNIFNSSDIEKKTKFETIIQDYHRAKTISCRLWKQNNNNNLRVICEINEVNNFDFSHDISFHEVSFEYNDYVINIEFHHFNIKKLNYEIPFLYSDRQIIEIKNDIDSYNLKFKIGTYNDELLYLYGEMDNSLILDKCEKNENELNCKVTKEKLEEILVKNNEIFRVAAVHDTEGLFKFINVLDITINHKIIQKEDIYIGINGSLTNEIEARVPFGFTTNVTNMPNIYSDINDNCYFKKFNDNPLLYLCRLDETPKEPFKFGNITEEIVLDNLHYKYNFRIQPFGEIYKVSIKEKETNVKLIFPEELNFTSVDILTLNLIVPLPSQLKFLYLNPNSSSYLECGDLKEMKKCKISVIHFLKQKSSKFYLHYSNSATMIKKYYDLSPIKVTLPNSIVEILIEKEDNKNYLYIVDKGLLYFKTNYNDNETNIFDISDIEEKTTFVTTLKSIGDIKCRLWKPLNESMWLFCKLNDSLISENVRISIKDAVFHYKEYTVLVVFHADFFEVKTSNFPFLYSDKQIINIKEEIDSYDLKFHIGSYNEQPLCLSLDEMKNIVLQNKKNEKDLILNIQKEKFYEIFTDSNQKIKIYSCDYSLRKIEFKAIYDIIINFDNIKKEDIFIEITKLLTNNVDLNTFSAFETNITNISDIISDSFEFSYFQKFNCRIKKSGQTPLLIICLMSKEGTFSLEKIENEIILDNINVKYNFKIQPVDINGQCEVNGDGNNIQFIYPTILNYYLNDSINIDIYYYGNSDKIPKITLNPDSKNELTCNNLENGIQRCIVPKNHFDGKGNGDYPIFYYNYLNKKTTIYQLSPIQVILPKENEIIIRIKKEDNKKIIKIGQKGVLFLITNFKDENNTFKDILISFNSTIKDQNNYKYNVNCKLWIQKNENSKIICKLNENLIYNNQKILLNNIEITYNAHNIIITQQEPFEVEQLDNYISFLYSDEQNIEIEEGIKSYNIKFYIGKYNNEILYLYGERNNYIVFDNCRKNENESELSCQISKEKLEEILILNNEQFKVGAINDSLGIIHFDFIQKININYKNDTKTDIYVEITDLLSKFSYPGTPIAFKTNVTDIPNIISDKFKLCYFKKNKEAPLLYLCNFDRNKRSYTFDDKIIMDNSHYKYNFIIQPTEKTYYFELHEIYYGTIINLVYPEILNFTSNEESFTLRYIMPNPISFGDLNLVSNTTNTKCEDINGLKKCNVTLLHFLRQKNGYYYLNQSYSDKSFIHYELNPINVILPENIEEIFVSDEGNEYSKYILIGKNRFFSFVTNYTDDNNIFSDVKEKIYFNTTFSKRYFENTLPVSSAVRGMNEALESGASLMDNNILNCMGMAMENVLARPASAVSRNSDDFFPDREGSFTEHLLENAYNAIYHDELYCCDWDMFWTSHPDGRKHSLLRAISGGPVYFSDRVGETNPDVLRPLAYLDGSLPMMIRSAKPTEDCVFSDPRSGGVLKLHNAAPWGSGMAGGIAVYNLTGEQQSFSFAPSDIPELEKSRRYWVYDWFGKQAWSIGTEGRFEGTMDAQGFGWYVILPEKESLSCLGLTEKYVGFSAVEYVSEAPSCTTLVLRETGTVSWLSHRECRNAELNGADITSKIVTENSVNTLTKVSPEEGKNSVPAFIYTLHLEEKPEKAVLCIRW